MFAFFQSMFAALAAIPALIKAIESLRGEIKGYQSELQNARIDSAVKAAKEAKSDEELIKVAHAEADITSKL